MTDHPNRSAGSEVQLPLSTDMVLTAAKEVQKHLNEVSKPYSAGIVGDCIVEIERLRDQLSFAEFEWRRATDGMKERDATIAFLSGAPAQPAGEPGEEDVAIALFVARHHGLTNIMPWDDIDHDGRDYWRTIARNLMRTHRVVPVSHSSAASEPVAYVPRSKAPGSEGEPLWREVFAAKWLSKGTWQGFDLMPLYSVSPQGARK